MLSGQQNARVLLGEVTDIDLEARTVTSQVLGRETVTPYDSLIVAAGAGQSYFGNDQFAEFAPGMKSIDDALELRGRIFGAFEMAELGAIRGENVDHLLTFVVVGAGPTGVEMAGQIAELAHRTLKRDFRAINTREARVILVDAAAAGAAAVRRTSSAPRPRSELEKLGVEVHARRDGHRRRRARHRGEVQGRHASSGSTPSRRSGPPACRPARWAATLSEQTGAPLDRAGRIAVNPDLTLPGHPEVFVVGDMIALDNLPGVAQVAIQGAKYAAKEIDGRLEGKPPQEPFKYFDKGSMAIISRFRAVAMVGKLRLTGVDRLADVAGRAPRLHHRLQEPGHRAAALGGLVPRPRPLGADHHRAADLRAQRAGAARARRRRPGLATRGVRRRARAARDDPARRARGAGRRGGPAHRRRRARRARGRAAV